MMILSRSLFATVALVAAATFDATTFAVALPAPVAGISFDEWAAANARIAKGSAKADVLRVLGASEADWHRADVAFLAALKAGQPDDDTFRRMGEVYEHPSVGRFATLAEPAKPPNRLETYDDWAKVQAHLIAANHAGADIDAALAEHGLTAASWADQSRPWIEVMRRTADSPWTPERVALEHQRDAVLKRYLADYDRRYGKGPSPYP